MPSPIRQSSEWQFASSISPPVIFSVVSASSKIESDLHFSSRSSLGGASFASGCMFLRQKHLSAASKRMFRRYKHLLTASECIFLQSKRLSTTSERVFRPSKYPYPSAGSFQIHLPDAGSMAKDLHGQREEMMMLDESRCHAVMAIAPAGV